MVRTKNRIAAALLSVALAFAMAGAVSVCAFADELTAGAMPQATDTAVGEASQEMGIAAGEASQALDTMVGVAPQATATSVAYDTVYGVFGGEYALMMKSVTLVGLGTATTTDVVDSNGAVVVHTATVPEGVKSDGTVAEVVSAVDAVKSDGTVAGSTSAVDWRSLGLGEWTDYEIGSMYGYADDISAGYVMLTDRRTSEVGLKKLKGDGWLVPCKYDALVANEIDGGFVGFEFGTPKSPATTTVTFFNRDGSAFGKPASLVVDLSEETYRYASASEMYGYLWVCVAGSSDSASVYFERKDDGYQAVLDWKRIYDQDEDGSLLVMKNSGAVFYRPPSGPEVQMEASGTVSSCWVVGDYVALLVDGKTIYCSKVTGKQASDGTVGFGSSPDGADGAGGGDEADGADGGDEADASDGATPHSGDDDPDSADGADGGDGADGADGADAPDGADVPDGTAPHSGDDESVSYSFGGKTIVAKRFYSQSTGKYVASVTDESGAPVAMRGYTLGIAADCGEYTMFNSVKRGASDVWWATNAAGKWGAINSKGDVVVPFEFESYYDAGRIGIANVLVKRGGTWCFYDVATGRLQPPGGKASVIPKPSDADKPVEPVEPTPPKGLPTGSTAVVGGATYKVANDAAATAIFQTAPKAKSKAEVPQQVVINDKKYAVVGIAKKAFADAKAKTVVIKSAKLTKAGVKDSLKGSKVKTIKVSAGSKSATKQLVKKYKKLFTKANCGVKVTVK